MVRIALFVLLAIAPIPMKAQEPPPPVPTPPIIAPVAPAPAPVPAAAPVYPTSIAGKDLATWLKDLNTSPDANMRENAARAIPLFGPSARAPALRPLLDQLSKETDPGVKMNIIQVLGLFGTEKPEVSKMIVERFNTLLLNAGPGTMTRLHTTRALANYGPAAANVIPTVLAIADDTAWETRQAVMYTLARLGRAPDDKREKGPNVKVLDVLAKRLQDEKTATVRLEIAQSMLLLGPPAYRPNDPADYMRVIKPYLEAVEKRLTTETDGPTRVWLLMTQMTYDGNAYNDATVSKIADYINKPENPGRVAALRALALLGEKARPALPTMIGSLRWTEPDLLVEGMIALAAMKTVAKDALPELERIKAGPDEYLKNVATQAIDIISGKNNPAAPKK